MKINTNLSKLLYKKWKSMVSEMNDKGLPLPTVRDPKTGKGSVSLTLVFLSSFLIISGHLLKWFMFDGQLELGGIMEFFYASCALYFGRKWQVNSGVEVVESIKQEPEK
jgi:hypothetical protein